MLQVPWRLCWCQGADAQELDNLSRHFRLLCAGIKEARSYWQRIGISAQNNHLKRSGWSAGVRRSGQQVLQFLTDPKQSRRQKNQTARTLADGLWKKPFFRKFNPEKQTRAIRLIKVCWYSQKYKYHKMLFTITRVSNRRILRKDHESFLRYTTLFWTEILTLYLLSFLSCVIGFVTFN